MTFFDPRGAVGLDPLINVPLRDLDARGRERVTFVTFSSAAHKAYFLAELARQGAEHPEIVALARRLGTIEACHAYVRDRIRYAHEPAEKLETAVFTLHDGHGDCDAQIVLLVALVLAIGGGAVVSLQGGTPDDPAHVVAALCAAPRGVRVLDWQPFGWPAPAGYQWAETTITIARFGEIPIEAKRREGPGGDRDGA